MEPVKVCRSQGFNLVLLGGPALNAASMEILKHTTAPASSLSYSDSACVGRGEGASPFSLGGRCYNSPGLGLLIHGLLTGDWTR